MDTLARWAWRRFGARFFAALFLWELASAFVIAAGTVALLSLYQSMSFAQYVHIVLLSWVCILAGLGLDIRIARPRARPLLEWARGRRGPEGAEAAWRAGLSLPMEIITHALWHPVVFVAMPVSAFVTWHLGLPWYSEPVVFAGAIVAIAYSAVLHFFVAEIAMRPVVHDIALQLPREFSGEGSGVPLRWKLLGTLPLINVVTGVVVSGLSTSHRHSLRDLGLDVIVALLVSFTISLEITVLVTKSILGPVRDLLASTERVKEGDLSARVPVVSGDEVGQLARSFNLMMTGLEERAALREAFGSYVDPGVAERVIAEGQMIEGEDVEVTVMFIDMLNFTAFAERASARETVARLNDLFGLIVPLLAKHRGHANKFIGDGVMGVFGAPEPLRDHARRALDAACEIAAAVAARYGDALEVGIGINSGPASVGSIGGGGRLEFAVIGDTVNVAARVERLTRETGDSILLTEATRTLLDGAGPALEPRGEVPIRGRSDRVPVYTPVPGPIAARGAGRPAEAAR